MEIHVMTPEVIDDVAKTGVLAISADKIDNTFKSTSIDLASSSLGSKVLAFSDEWFAAASNLITATPPIRRPGVFTHAGAWYDGWETRRHNAEPFDWVVLKLGVASGRVHGVEVDTAFFNGNHAPEIAVQGCFLTSDDADEQTKNPSFDGWHEILGIHECGPTQRHAWQLAEPTQQTYTHVRLQMFPDGGIARFRLYGQAVPVFPQDVDAVIDLAAAVNGGVAVACSDQHFGTAANLLLSGRGVDMGDGWETKRTRGVHVDWTVVRLGAPTEVVKLLVDTAHFRGNFPKEVQVFAIRATTETVPHDDKGWVEILAPQRTGPDKEHEYEGGVLTNVAGQTYTHAKLVMIPDGGIKRFRVFGKRRNL